MSASSLPRRTRNPWVSLAGSHGSSISPFKKRSYCSVHTIWLSASRTSLCSVRNSASRFASRVPIVSVPLNIMCSKKWLIPVIPGRSLTLPTFATHPALTTFGWSVRGTRRNCIPLGSVSSSTATCWAVAGRMATNNPVTRTRRHPKRAWRGGIMRGFRKGKKGGKGG